MDNRERELLLELHKDNNRQGPGSESVTLQALSLLPFEKSIPLKIADIGCGSGAQTITLATHTNSVLTAVDLFPEFLEKLQNTALSKGLSERITTMACSMENLPFDDNMFDLIWSEGAIYNMGFKEGITEWKRFLKPKGYLAVSEISWLTADRPKEIEKYWKNEYAQIDTISRKVQNLEENGYSPVAHFVIPENCWLENYYRPLQHGFASFLDRHQGDKIAQDIIDNEKKEIAMYEQYKEYVGYGFYIAQKR